MKEHKRKNNKNINRLWMDKYQIIWQKKKSQKRINKEMEKRRKLNKKREKATKQREKRRRKVKKKREQQKRQREKEVKALKDRKNARASQMQN